MTSAMNDLIRQTAGVTGYAGHTKRADVDDDGLGGDITPDADQGRRTIAASPPMSMLISDRIRQAAGMSVRPGHLPVPEVVGY